LGFRFCWGLGFHYGDRSEMVVCLLAVLLSAILIFNPILYVSAGFLGAMAFIWGFGTKW